MQFTKYIHILNLLSQVPDPKGHLIDNPVMTQQQAADCWDHIFHYVFENFEDPRVTYPEGVRVHLTAGEIEIHYKACKKLLHGTPVVEFMEKFERIPPVYSELLFPVAVGIFLLRYKMIPMNHRATSTFHEFHNRYGRFILHDC